MTILEAAFEYDRRGWCIIPIRAGTKKPALAVWKPHQSDRPSIQDLHGWFSNGGHTALAVVLGPVSGNLVCRDFDKRESYEAWSQSYPDLAATLPTSATFRGRHVYFRANMEVVRRHSPTGSCTIKLGDGELRGVGAYVVLPPSPHPDGATYQWLIPPNGELPMLDPLESGFFGRATESTETPERTETTERTEIPERTETTEHTEELLRPLCALCDSLLQEGEWPPEIEETIRDSLPKRPGERHRHVFEFARGLKAIPALNAASEADLRPIVRHWHQLALPHIRTQPFEETWIDFLKAWPRVKFPKGKEPMSEIVKRAIAAEIPKDAAPYEQDKLKLLVALCRELQRSAGGGFFYLSCRIAGRLLGVDHTTANRWLFLLVKDGILATVEKGGTATQRATRFRYLRPL